MTGGTYIQQTQTISGGGSGVIDGKAFTFADLPNASANSGKIYIVESTTGIRFINRKKSGMYRSDGTNWNRLSDTEDFLKAGDDVSRLNNDAGYGAGGTSTISASTDLEDTGTTGQILVKQASGNYAHEDKPTDGADGANGQGVPLGGAAGQVLSKIDGTDFNTEWTTPTGGSGIPNGGTTGQVLAKASNTDQDAEWIAAPSGGGGSSVRLYNNMQLSQTAEFDNENEWACIVRSSVTSTTRFYDTVNAVPEIPSNIINNAYEQSDKLFGAYLYGFKLRWYCNSTTPTLNFAIYPFEYAIVAMTIDDLEISTPSTINSWNKTYTVIDSAPLDFLPQSGGNNLKEKTFILGSPLSIPDNSLLFFAVRRTGGGTRPWNTFFLRAEIYVL